MVSTNAVVVEARIPLLQLWGVSNNTYWLVCHLIKDTYVIWKKAYIPEDISFDNNKEEYAFRVMNIYNVFRSGDMHKTFLSRINCLTLKDIFIVPMNGGNLNEKF